nr:unnamed protein product [Callosobruchus analis]
MAGELMAYDGRLGGMVGALSCGESDSSDDASIKSASPTRASSKQKSLQKRHDEKRLSVKDNPSNKEIMEFMSARFT